MINNWYAAQNFLQENRIEDWETHRLRDVAGLPAHLRPFAWGLLGLNERGQPVEDAHMYVPWGRPVRAARLSMAQYQALDDLPAAERLLIFTALFPRCAAAVEAAWQLQKGFPYSLLGTRRAFRAPHRPALTLSRRAQWLTHLLSTTYGLEKDVVWFAQYATQLGMGWSSMQLGVLFAGAIEQGGDNGQQVYDLLVAAAEGEAAHGMMGRHVPQGLLSASRPEGWAVMERLLLAAQRQEGLRQVILETVDESHPEAFRRMIHLLRQQNLVRFNSVVRAVDVWLGLAWEAADARQVQRIIEQLDDFLSDEAACTAALAGGEPSALYLALCVRAFTDAVAATPLAIPYLRHEQVEYRFAAAYFLAQLHLPEARQALAPLLLDPDLRVATAAFHGVLPSAVSEEAPADLFERLEEALPRFPAERKALPPLVWPWLSLSAGRADLAHWLPALQGERPLTRLLPYISLLDPSMRARLAGSLKSTKSRPLGETQRDLLLRFLGDASSQVRRAAVEAAQTLTITTGEAAQLEAYLTRKAGDLRRGLLQLLLNQPDEAVLSTAGRLLSTGHPLQRQAGQELLAEMQKAKRSVERCQTLAEQYQVQHSRPVAGRQPPTENLSLDNGLGLYDPAALTPPLQPKPKKNWLRRPVWVTPAAKACLTALDDLIHSHRQTPVTITVGWNEVQSTREELLGNVQGTLGWRNPEKPMAEEAERYPLMSIWRAWCEERPAALRDGDGWELVRALAPLADTVYHSYQMQKQTPKPVLDLWQNLYGGVEVHNLRYGPMIREILWWLVQLYPPAGQGVGPILDAVEVTLAAVPAGEQGSPYAGRHSGLLGWLSIAKSHRQLCPAAWQAEDDVRFWRLIKGRPPEGYYALHSIQEVLRAFRAGGATEADILAYLIGPRQVPTGFSTGYSFHELTQLSGRRPPAHRQLDAPNWADPVLRELINRCRRRIVEVESRRGDIATAASDPALALRYSGGLDALISLLPALGQEPFARGWSYYGSHGRANVLSHLIRVTFPGEADTPANFAAQMKQAAIPRQRLIELALYAPQWAGHVQAALDWPAFTEAVWWFHAHTKDNHWQVDAEIRDTWNAEAQEHTPLTGPELLEGAVDVAWFWRVYHTLGAARWRELDQAAKYTSGGGGHKRAQLFAEAMLGRLHQEELTQRISGKRYQDAVRALGLLPLPTGDGRDPAILNRYLIIQEFVRGSRKFGSQRQASEKLAAQIGLENLARTAGYPDPLRLQWAMEQQAIADLAAGPVASTVEGVTVSLAIDEWGAPQIEISKNGRPLKNVPPKVKKDGRIATLLERKKEIEKQLSRTRQALEQAMCRGDHFSGRELQQLLDHPVLRPMLAQLLFIGEQLLGYPVEGGRALEGVDGALQPLAETTMLRLAHPHDLLRDGRWHLWQRECFRRERIQPFKQIFRELYVLTPAEAAEGNISRRYAGHQVNSRQAMALFGSRGWVIHPYEGVRRTFHDEGITAWISAQGALYTPADVGGLTLEGVHFARRGEWQTLPLAQLPPRLFSEVMRDLDLVVSVAHLGGVDPEATASTVEMRAAVVRETADLLKLSNVRPQKNHVLIEGSLNNYSIHLGSGVVHQQPGGYLCIIPVHAQQRGRLFLPFVDDDPKTAEIVAKLVLLARDREIKDPTILEQITAVR